MSRGGGGIRVGMAMGVPFTRTVWTALGVPAGRGGVCSRFGVGLGSGVLAALRFGDELGGSRVITKKNAPTSAAVPITAPIILTAGNADDHIGSPRVAYRAL